MQYIRFSENYNINKLIPALESPYKHIKDVNKPYFISMMKYSDKQFKEWMKTKSLKGMDGSITDRIWADFDSANLTDAFNDAKVFYSRLTNLGLKEENIQIAFSGNKGIGFIVDLNITITLEQVKNIVFKLAEGLKTFDTSMYDNQRIFRLLFTKHEVSQLYKIPLSPEELQASNIDDIITNARSLDQFNQKDVLDYYQRYTPIGKFLELIKDAPVITQEKTKKSPPIILNLKEALVNKPRHWKDYKWALAQGFFEEGERHNALMVIAATCRGVGYDKQTAYYICKAALKKQAERTNQEEFDKSELWENIIEQSVYTDGWQGGQYSPQNNKWLKSYCERMGFNTDQQEDEKPAVSFDDMTDSFFRFSSEFEKNVIKIGIPELDNNVTLVTSSLNGLLGQPGAGKTTLALNYLRNTSRAGVTSMFFSLDMGQHLVYSKMIQKETGMDFKRAVSLFKTELNTSQAKEIALKIKEDYKNVGFNFKAGLTVSDIRKAIRDYQEQIGKKVKLVVIDYLECIAGSSGDPTVNAGINANLLKDVANEEEVCILLLLQTQKHSTPDVSDPLLSLKGVKGSSLIEQSCSSILTLWREGYNPKYTEYDKYISFAVVKNRFGGLWSGDFSWTGVSGEIRSLTEEESEELNKFRQKKKEEKKVNEKNSGWD